MLQLLRRPVVRITDYASKPVTLANRMGAKRHKTKKTLLGATHRTTPVFDAGQYYNRVIDNMINIQNIAAEAAAAAAAEIQTDRETRQTDRETDTCTAASYLMHN